MTPERIANAIMQDKAFTGAYILVEGKKDLKMYRKFFSKSDARMRPTWGKYAQRSVWDLLDKREFDRKIAIRDADFLRIPGNPKYDANYVDSIFVTDFHDSEIVAVESHVLDEILPATHDIDILERFEQKNGHLKDVVKRMARPIGVLRLANKREKLGLSFKPAKPDGNKLKFNKFINLEVLEVDVEKMINTIWEYSKNRGAEVKSKNEISAAYLTLSVQNFTLEELINGHDFSEIIGLVSSKNLKCNSKIFSDSDTFEEALAATFSKERFGKTALFASIDKWQKTNYAPRFILA